MEVHPLQSFPSSETGRGFRPRNEAAMMEVKEERNRPENDELSAPVSPSINLGLHIGTNSAGNRSERVSTVHRRESLLTAGQFHELQQQVLIHKYLAAGLRVPTHLLVPIWKSVARTSDSNGFHERHRSFIGFSPVGFDYRSMMDPEPGRCRRTDGKKWRCSRNIVPNQKYCERHMHRGRQRSRKHVEASENDSPSKKILLDIPDKTKNHLSCDFPIGIPFPPVEAVVSGATSIVTSCPNTTKTIRTSVPSINPIATTSIPTGYIVDLKDVCSMSFRENCCKSRNVFGRNDVDVQKILSPALGFSPNSVLQVPGCSSSLCDSKINLELEPGRCRRTDGKKWRCRRDVIPDQKYCGMHMHRGSKKHLRPFQNAPVFAPSAATYATTLLPLAMPPHTKPEPATPNTNLSMSIQADDNQRHNEGRSNVSSSSDTNLSMSIQADDNRRRNEDTSNVSSSSETTITDTTITG